MSVTLKDIARRLNLTEPSVSMALRAYPNIAPETIKRVREVAKELGYRPNMAARNLRSRNSKVVGFVFNDLLYGYSQQIVDGAKSIFMEKGYLPMIGVASWDVQQEAREVDILLGYCVEAIVSIPMVESNSTYQRVVDMGIPLVFVGNGLDIKGASWIGLDGYDAAEKIVEHFLSLGHKKIALIGTDTITLSLGLSQRLEGYKAVLAKHGLPFRKDYVALSKLGHKESVKQAVDNLLCVEEPPTAIFCITDMLAYSAMDHLRQIGKRIPDDIAIAGSGDVDPSSFDMISLTTVREDSFRIGVEAARQILRHLENIEEVVEPIRMKLEGELVVRKSTIG